MVLSTASRPSLVKEFAAEGPAFPLVEATHLVCPLTFRLVGSGLESDEEEELRALPFLEFFLEEQFFLSSLVLSPAWESLPSPSTSLSPLLLPRVPASVVS